MCNEVVKEYPYALECVPISLTTPKMCNKAVQDKSGLFKYIPDWFVMQEEIDVQHDDAYYYNNDELIEWYEGYKN